MVQYCVKCYGINTSTVYLHASNLKQVFYKQYQESDIPGIRKERECFTLIIPCINALHNNSCSLDMLVCKHLDTKAI